MAMWLAHCFFFTLPWKIYRTWCIKHSLPASSHRSQLVSNSRSQTNSGWWFGTCFIFPYIGLLIIPIDFHIFSEGWRKTTNQKFLGLSHSSLTAQRLTHSIITRLIHPVFPCHRTTESLVECAACVRSLFAEKESRGIGVFVDFFGWSRVLQHLTTMTGWWFGCHQFYFPINIGLRLSSQLTFNFFQRGGLTTNQMMYIHSRLWYSCGPTRLLHTGGLRRPTFRWVVPLLETRSWGRLTFVAWKLKVFLLINLIVGLHMLAILHMYWCLEQICRCVCLLALIMWFFRYTYDYILYNIDR